MDILLVITTGLSDEIEVDLYNGDFKNAAAIEDKIEEEVYDFTKSKFVDNEWPDEWNEYNLFVNFDGYEVEPTVNQLAKLVNLDCNDEEIIKAALEYATDLDSAIDLVKGGYEYYRDEGRLVDGFLEILESDTVDHLRGYIDEDKLVSDLKNDYTELPSGGFIRWYY